MGMDSEIQGITPQPPPKLGEKSESVTDFLVTFMRGTRYCSLGQEGVSDRVANDLLARREAGTMKYGVELCTFNGRDALVDAYQEAVDLLVYYSQYLLESGETEGGHVCDIFDIADIVVMLREKLEKRNP